MASLRERIRISLANENLQTALDANTERRVKGRIAAFESLPDWRERRQRARAIRADVIENLEPYLNQFIAQAFHNGFLVHRARDAAEALQIVLQITKSNDRSRRNPPLIAKSKSMVSEEINLNHALEKENMRVVETDLGEYIVQLRNERPSHIITPAVHLRRGDVGQLFHEKLGIPYTEDIPTLTNTARKVLREVFLTADVGISGVNFAIAETGGICLVTNEGNGRMVTTLPPVHIALMGMERLVPTLDDLALMLSLLARSATTQKISVYTQLIHQPLPGQQRHLIVLDNGRSRLRDSALKEALYCIRCGACLNACPVFRELGGHAYQSVYPGPIGSVISAGLFGSDFVPLAQASSLCGACKEACPVDIDLPKLLTRVRAGQSPASNEPSTALREGGGLSRMSRLFLTTYSRLATHPRLFTLSQKFAWLGTTLLAPFSDHVRLPAFTGWGYSKDLPRFAGKTFRERFVATDTTPAAITGQGRPASSERPATQRVAEPTLTRGAMVERFIAELTRVNGQVLRLSNGQVTSTVIDLLQARNLSHLHAEMGVLNTEQLAQAGITVTHTADPRITLGVTKALGGVAETGSILEANGSGDKLKASLLPEVHVVILRESEIRPALGDTMPLVRNTQSAVFITGPSRTSDIEMTLTVGVHGPGELIVLLVDD